MTMPPLPELGDAEWRSDWGQAVHNAAAEVVSGRLSVTEQRRITVNVRDYGAAGNWNPTANTGADDTAAFQTALNALPPGGALFAPVGRYKVNGLTISAGKRLVGAGWQSWRDGADGFGSAGYLDPAIFGGTVLYSTTTAATPVLNFTSTPLTQGGSATTQGGLENLAIIGPGTGTASRGVLIGSTTQAVVNPIWRNVHIANFSVGVEQHNTNEGSFYDLIIRGCGTGLSLAHNVNNNAFYMLDIQRCDLGLVDDATCLANGFYNFIGQSCIDAVRLNGQSHTFVSPYLELNSGWSLDFVTAKYCSVISLNVQGSGNRQSRVQSGAQMNEFTGLRTIAGAVTIANAGYGNFFSGILAGLTDTGSNTQKRDLNAGTVAFPNVEGGIRVASASKSADYTAVLGDAGKAIHMSLASAGTFTVPNHADVPYPVGTVLWVLQDGAGKVTIAGPGNGVTRVPTGTPKTTRAQNSEVRLRKLANDVWVVSGDLG